MQWPGVSIPSLFGASGWTGPIPHWSGPEPPSQPPPAWMMMEAQNPPLLAKARAPIPGADEEDHKP